MIGPYFLKKGTKIERFDVLIGEWRPFVTTRDATYSTVDVLGQGYGVVELTIPSKRYPRIEVNAEDLHLVSVTPKTTILDPETVVKAQMMKAIANQLDKEIMGEK